MLISNLKVQSLDFRYNRIQVLEWCSEFSFFCFWTVLPPLVLALFSGNSRILSSLSVVISREKRLLHIMSPAKAPGLSQMSPFGGHLWTKYWIQGDGRRLFGRPESHAHFATKKRGGVKASPTQSHWPSTRKVLLRGAPEEAEMGVWRQKHLLLTRSKKEKRLRLALWCHTFLFDVNIFGWS